MKLYDVTRAPNPRRVRVFAAEKGIALNLVQVDMMAGEHKSPEYLKKNPSGKIPVLELDDGTCIPESVAICRYLEALHPTPSLFGQTPVELGLVEARNRQIELELLSQVGTAWVNGPIVAKMAAGRFTQIPEAKSAAEANVNTFYARLNQELEGREFLALDRYTVADITLMITIDFATTLVELKPDASNTTLWEWHQRVSSRPSATA